MLSIFYIGIIMIFLSSKYVLLDLGQNPLVVEKAYNYVLVMIPATYLQGLQDLQRKFLIQVGKSHIQMNTQIMATFV